MASLLPREIICSTSLDRGEVKYMSSYAQGLAGIVAEARECELPPATPRHDIVDALPEPATFNLVHIITGVRRCGKTFYAFQLMRRLLDRGVSRDRVFYFNFADDRLRPSPTTLLSDVVEEYWWQVPAARREGAYLFLDEVQEAGRWQGFCQRMAEHERVTLVVTGSSSRMSADEIATTFRGRSQEHGMMPLSFREYCAFHHVGVPSPEEARAGAVSPQDRTTLEGAFDRFLIEGGFPGVQTLSHGSRIQMLQAYTRDVVARDVVERYRRIGIDLANQVALYGLRNTAYELSVNNLVESLRSVGHRTSWETVHETIRLFEQAHLLDLLPEHSTSLSPRSTAQQKAYAVDQGMAYAVSRANQQDVGKRLETAAYLELKRRLAGSLIETITSYTTLTRSREKVDFLVGDVLGTSPYRLYQVTADMSAERTCRRELGSLEIAMRETKIERGCVITLREERTVETGSGSVMVVPAWKWFLGA